MESGPEVRSANVAEVNATVIEVWPTGIVSITFTCGGVVQAEAAGATTRPIDGVV